jgi:16S rRNA (adenine1518-N6/adenine1519-N6)-dimethyltransferase
VAHPKEILNSLKANARKSLSQNFLTSPHWADRLTDMATQVSCDEIWEIGPGLGALTKPLVSKAKVPVKIFEYDKIFAEYLKTEVPQATIFPGDFLETDTKTLLAKNPRVSILSNLPYHLSSPILRMFVQMKPNLVQLVLTFQKEFAERLLALPKTSAYGALTVMTQLHFKIETLGTIPPKAFFPPPEIASEALCLVPKANPPGIDAVDALVHAAFLHRRKKVIGNLKKAFPEGKWEAIFQQMGIQDNARAEELAKEQFLELARAYSHV